MLEVMPSGNKVWRHRYVQAGKQIWHTFGAFPVVTLDEARKRLAELKRDLDQGKDPRLAKRLARAAKADTFESIAREWLEKTAAQTAAKTAAQRLARFERHLFTPLGYLPISENRPAIALAAFRKLEANGSLHTARRLLQDCVAIADYAIVTERLTGNPFSALRKALKAETPRHFSAIVKPGEFGELLRAIDGYKGDLVTRYALQLVALLAVRSSELRHMRWDALDLTTGRWDLLAGEVKQRREHVVSLPRQAVEIIRELKPLTGRCPYVLGSSRGGRPLSENTLNAALRRLGYDKEPHMAHGFRASFITIGNEHLGIPREIINLSLCHAERAPNGGAYARMTKFPERAVAQQKWADYCDTLRGKVR